MFTGLKSFFGKKTRDERGASAVEYALIAGLMAVALIIAIGVLTGGISTSFTDIASTLSGGG